MKILIDYINKIHPLNKNEINSITDAFIPKKVKRNTSITKNGIVADTIYFLEKGVVKGYQNDDGKLIVNHLIESGNFFVDFNSFQNRTVALDVFETVTNCDIYTLSKANFNSLNNNTSFFKILINSIHSSALTCKMERINDFQKLTAKERYLKMLKESPNLVNTVTINDLSSYLGIEAPSLSRIRKQIF